MKKSKTETAATRRRIVEVAADTFKAQGIHATGVAEIMAAAGLTHGGFYRHFESKEQLVAEACANSMNDLVALAEAAAEGGDETLVQYIEHFLSPEFRDKCAGGCPLVTMGSEIARADKDTRRAATAGIRKMADILGMHSQMGKTPEARADAVFMVAAMIGAVTVSRIVDDPAFSEQILTVARKRLAGPTLKPHKKRARPKAA